jgi:putative transposase
MPRPRVRGWVSRASQRNERWAMAVTHIPCGQDGRAHLAAVIDCHDREIVGYEFALRSRAKEAEQAIETACLARFGTLRPTGATVLSSDNGLIFQNRRFRQACRNYRLEQEFIMPLRPSRTASLNDFFGRSKKNVCASRCFKRLRRQGGSFGTGCTGTTTGGHTAPRATEAPSNTGRNHQPRWLDFRGALHPRVHLSELFAAQRNALRLAVLDDRCTGSSILPTTVRHMTA